MGQAGAALPELEPASASNALRRSEPTTRRPFVAEHGRLVSINSDIDRGS
jgi:hypothetical protein